MANNLPSKLSKAINSLIISNPFFATIILQRNIIIDDSCDTAWTDGDTIAFSTKFIEENDQDYIIETIEVLEALTEVPSLKDEELDVIGELISNMYGALEVNKMVKTGTDKKEALNTFMKRVLGSIDK